MKRISKVKINKMIAKMPTSDKNFILNYHELGYIITKNTIDTIKRNGKVGYKIIARVNNTGDWKPNTRGDFSYNKMKVLGITLEELAEYFNISRQTLARYVRGEKLRVKYKVSQFEINEFLDNVEYLANLYSIKPSIIIKKAIEQRIIGRRL